MTGRLNLKKMDLESERHIPLLPLQGRYVTFENQTASTNHSEAADGSEDGYDHLESTEEQDMFDEFNSLSDQEQRERRTFRRRTQRKEVTEFCRPRGLSYVSFMGALVDISLQKNKPEHHSVSEYVSKAGSPNNALLQVFKEEDNFRFTEGHITAYVVEILRCADTDVDVTDSDGNTALHLAAKRAFSNCAKELLKWETNPNKMNEQGETALEIALNAGLNENEEEKVGKYSQFAAVVIEDMRPAVVRNIFIANGIRHCKISFHSLINNPNMQEAVQAVLDTTVELMDPRKKVFRLHYSILESNSKGQTPDQVGRSQKKSAFDKIIGGEKKDIITHSSVRFLMQSKWKRFARYALICRAVLFVMIMTVMTASLVMGIDCDDPSSYKTTPDIIRGVLEGLTLLLITAVLYTEVCQIAMWRLQYFTEYYFFYFSYLTIITAVCLYIMVPLRIFDKRQQWVFGSIAYLCYGLKAFKFLMAIRSIGIYVYALALMIRKDVLLFIVVFAESLFAFSGAFYIALNSELVEVTINDTKVFINETETANNCSGVGVETVKETRLIPEAQLNRLETGSYFKVFFTGIRILIQGESVIENYARYSDDGGLGFYGVIQYLIFLFFVVIVLLSLLIAQMSDTFASIQEDADRIALLARAKVIISAERTGILGMNFRKTFYLKEEIWKQPKKYLTDITVPKIDIVSAMVGRLEKLCAAHSDILEELRDSLADQRKKEEVKMDKLLEELQRFNQQNERT